MSKRLSSFEKVRRSFNSLGIELVEAAGLYQFEYEGFPCLVDIDETYGCFSISQYVIVPMEDNISKDTFVAALDIMSGNYEFVEGQWMTECPPYISTSPIYMNKLLKVPKTYLSRIIQNFVEAYSFMQINLRLMIENHNIN